MRISEPFLNFIQCLQLSCLILNIINLPLLLGSVPHGILILAELFALDNQTPLGTFRLLRKVVLKHLRLEEIRLFAEACGW